ncbi:MAG: LEA type 2 family protein [Halorientalis sp.]
MSRLTTAFLGSTVRIVATILGLLVVVGVLGFLFGVFGVPGVAGVQNSFGPVNNTTTVIDTNLTVSNPNPIGVSLGGTSINYTVNMNDVRMASGHKEGVQVGTGNSSLTFRTSMDNDKIPAWWRSHIANGEHTQVQINATVRSSMLGGRTITVPQQKQIQTDIIGQFNSDETRPIDANQALVEDPVLYVNETSAQWDTENLSKARTPINMSFTVYNPKSYPYAVSELGYTITMNNITVGNGSSSDVGTILPGQTRRLQTNTAIQNQHLDEWWVSHLRRNQVTDLRIDFYLVVDSQAGGSFHIPLDAIDYHRTIETDIFGTKSESAGNSSTASDSNQSTGSGQSRSEQTTTTQSGSTSTPTSTDQPTTTTTDSGGLLG